jgi:hypothetical protein
LTDKSFGDLQPRKYPSKRINKKESSVIPSVDTWVLSFAETS